MTRHEITPPTPLTVTIHRTPHKFLLPNSGKHPRTQRPYRVALRDTAASDTINALRGSSWGWHGPILLLVGIWWEDGRGIPDWDNAIASLKGAIDGIFAKVGANDRQVSGIHLKQLKDPAGDGYMVVRLKALPLREGTAVQVPMIGETT